MRLLEENQKNKIPMNQAVDTNEQVVQSRGQSVMRYESVRRISREGASLFPRKAIFFATKVKQWSVSVFVKNIIYTT